jgi:hypothetical protein
LRSSPRLLSIASCCLLDFANWILLKKKHNERRIEIRPDLDELVVSEPAKPTVAVVKSGASVRYMTAFVVSLAKRERKSLHTRIKKLDLEQSIIDGLRLSD